MTEKNNAERPAAIRVLVFGGTGTAGRGVVRALREQGHSVTCVVRAGTALEGASVRVADVTAPDLAATFADLQFDVVVSCLASRTGTPKDAWAIDHDAQLHVLEVAKRVGAAQFILLSAICVQKPKLAFQRAKLAFEDALMASGLIYSIVRPTAFFKSLSGQIERVRDGRPFLMFGNGTLTACKPISDDDLGRFMVGCIDDEACHNRILPIGGPAPAITPMDQAEEMFRLLGRPVEARRVPVALMSAIIGVLRLGGLFSAKLAEKAELAKIGHYYGTESMLVFDADSGRYDAEKTPSFGTETLFDHYADLIQNDRSVARTDHSVF